MQGETTHRRSGVRASDKFQKSMNATTTAVTSQGPLLPIPVVSQFQRDTPFRNRPKSDHVPGGLRTRWVAIKKKFGTGTAPSTSSVLDDITGDSISCRPRTANTNGLGDEVDEVIVDRVWTEEFKHSFSAQSDSGMSPEKLGEGPMGVTNADQESLAARNAWWAAAVPLVILRWRIWPAILRFFRYSFIDEKSEAHYRQESWFFRKKLALWSALFLVVNWILATAFIPNPLVLLDKIFYYGIGPLVAFPTLVMVMYDFPRDRRWLYQISLTIATWSWAHYQILFIYLCGYYTGQTKHTYFTCGTKDFLSTFYYASALQTISLFGLNLHRFSALIGALCFFITSTALILPDRLGWLRNAIIFFAFQAFLLYVHYMRDNVERRLYTLRDQLKVQFKATQKAQINERRAADSKRRLTSYVFHEVRVPLNTALLAVQNMDAYGCVPKAQEIEFKALEGSLNMMSKVLNDVLDFHRMDSGRFESLNKPYPFHQVMRSLFVALRLDTDSRQLELITELDDSIDNVARGALYAAMGETYDNIPQYLAESSESDGIVVGDETRLRQIIANLAGNACKFTPAGGKITISTKLVIPANDAAGTSVSSAIESRKRFSTDMDGSTHDQLSVDHLSQHNRGGLNLATEWIVVRIEVSDTGCGIQQKDMDRGKLFTAFNQTEQGRQQGGKGTGLGLALVRQIVKLSGGRLGVRSKVASGSTFWVELPLAVGRRALPPTTLQSKRPSFDRFNSDWSPYPPPPTPEIEGRSSPPLRLTPPSTVLEHVMNSEGLIRLMPRKTREADRDSRTPGGEFAIARPPFMKHAQSRNSDEYTSPAQDTHKLMSESQNTSVNPQHLDLPKLSLPCFDGSLWDCTTANSISTLAGPPVSTPGSTLPGTELEPGLQVLVVDDDRMTRMLMERMLERLRCVVTTAVNGQQALQLLLGDVTYPHPPVSDENGSDMMHNSDAGNRELVEDSSSLQLRCLASCSEESKFAIVFLDNQMPVMSGVEMVQRLRKMGRRELVVGVTGNALLPDQEEYLGAGVDYILTKPVREENLRSMLIIAEERKKLGRRPPQRGPPP